MSSFWETVVNEFSVSMILDSDYRHFMYAVGGFQPALQMLKQVGTSDFGELQNFS